MADILASGKRILSAYGVGEADRIPIVSPISWHPMRDIDKENPGGWRADPGFRSRAWCRSIATRPSPTIMSDIPGSCPP
jgi:hypothetical protein